MGSIEAKCNVSDLVPERPTEFIIMVIFILAEPTKRLRCTVFTLVLVSGWSCDAWELSQPSFAYGGYDVP